MAVKYLGRQYYQHTGQSQRMNRKIQSSTQIIYRGNLSMSLNISMPSLATIGSTIAALLGNIAEGICRFGRMVRRHTTGRLLESTVNRAIRDGSHDKITNPTKKTVGERGTSVVKGKTHYNLKTSEGDVVRSRGFGEYCLDRALKPVMKVLMNSENPATSV